MSKVRSFLVWTLEMLCEAIGTALWMSALAIIYARPGVHNDLSFRMIFGVGTVILMEFALTGYLITTLISSLYLPQRQRLLYPLISAGLYLIHSEIFFVALGNQILDKQNIWIQIGGAFIALASTVAGNSLRGIVRNERKVISGLESA